MIAVDSSALIAILLQEPDASALSAAMEHSSGRILSAANWVETSIVIESRAGDTGAVQFDALVERAGIEVRPVSMELARAARLGYRLYGKGRHKASLNYGDCFSYALARLSGAPLLAKGDEFGLTNVALVQY